MTRVHAALFTLLIAFFADDYVKIRLRDDPDVWIVYMVDWMHRLLVLLLIFGLPVFKDFLHTAPQTLAKLPRRYGFHELLLPGIGLAMVLIFLDLFLNNTLAPWVDENFPSWFLFAFPKVENTALWVIDLTIGLVLVAISEELVFRRMAANFLERLNVSKPLIILSSAAIFSTIHWMTGPHHIATTFVIGVALMMIYLRWRSFWLVVFHHYCINFVVFYIKSRPYLFPDPPLFG